MRHSNPGRLCGQVTRRALIAVLLFNYHRSSTASWLARRETKVLAKSKDGQTGTSWTQLQWLQNIPSALADGNPRADGARFDHAMLSVSPDSGGRSCVTGGRS